MGQRIGENIKAMRKKCGYTQEEVARQLSVTPQTISKWENNNGLPEITMLEPLAKIFGVSTDYLLGVETTAFGDDHTKAAESYVQRIFAREIPIAEKQLAAYNYLCMESEKEPNNFSLMCMCISHAAEINRYANFDAFLADKPELIQRINDIVNIT